MQNKHFQRAVSAVVIIKLKKLKLIETLRLEMKGSFFTFHSRWWTWYHSPSPWGYGSQASPTPWCRGITRINEKNSSSISTAGSLSWHGSFCFQFKCSTTKSTTEDNIRMGRFYCSIRVSEVCSLLVRTEVSVTPWFKCTQSGSSGQGSSPGWGHCVVF